MIQWWYFSMLQWLKCANDWSSMCWHWKLLGCFKGNDDDLSREGNGLSQERVRIADPVRAQSDMSRVLKSDMPSFMQFMQCLHFFVCLRLFASCACQVGLTLWPQYTPAVSVFILCFVIPWGVSLEDLEALIDHWLLQKSLEYFRNFRTFCQFCARSYSPTACTWKESTKSATLQSWPDQRPWMLAWTVIVWILKWMVHTNYFLCSLSFWIQVYSRQSLRHTENRIYTNKRVIARCCQDCSAWTCRGRKVKAIHVKICRVRQCVNTWNMQKDATNTRPVCMWCCTCLA